MRVSAPGRGGGRGMIVAGVMSGTSADGVEVAVCRIARGRDGAPRMRVLGHTSTAYPKAVREAVLRAMDASAIAVAELSRLSWRLGGLYADAVERAAAQVGVAVQLVGCHGQTIYHQAAAAAYLGEPVRCTWQTGEAAVIAERMRCAVVSDFRPADMTAGGQGAPLVPMLDFCMFRSAGVGRVLLNLGGIANVTAMPAACSLADVLAFDTGPGNMVIDGCMRRLYGREYDDGGAVASTGRALGSIVDELLRSQYFSALPPKSCGREEFGERFTEGLVARCRKVGAKDADVVATATAVTGRSVVDAYDWFAAERLAGAGVEVVVAGGGTKNAALMGMLAGMFGERGVRVRRMEELGVAAEAKEAVAFALLAWLTWHGLPGNVAEATGAARPVVLGKISLG